LFFLSSRRRHTRSKRDWSSDVCSSDLDCTVTLFPEPDSPTIANVSPSCNSKFTSRTACTSPPYVRNDTDKLFTSKTFFMSDSSQLIDDLLDLKRLLIRHQQH